MAKAKKVTKKAKEVAPMLLINSRVREYIKAQDTRCSSDFVEEFNRQTFLNLKRALKRCSSNSRATLRPWDAS